MDFQKFTPKKINRSYTSLKLGNIPDPKSLQYLF